MQLIDKISKKISNELNYDNEQFEVINYGAFAFFQTILSVLLISIFGFIFNVLIEALFTTLIAGIYRNFSGGVHASKAGICLIIGTIMAILMGLTSKYLSFHLNIYLLIIFVIIIFSFSFYVVLKYAPVDSANKPITSHNKRQKLRNITLIILFLYIILIVFIFISFKAETSFKYILCINIAVLWQSFNLTIIGHKLLTKVDSIFKNLLYERRENNEKS